MDGVDKTVRDAQAFAQEWRHKSEQTMYVTSRHTLFGDVLRRARAGTLLPDWRERLADDPYPAAFVRRGTPIPDHVLLAEHELANMVVQPWEPYAAQGNWREALDAWYSDTLALESEFEANRFAAKPRPPESPAAPVSDGRSQPPPPIAGSPLDRAVAAFSATEMSALAPHSEQPDWLAWYASGQAQQEAVDIRDRNYQQRKRDGFGLSYRAGLAAGGEESDWLGWYQQRVALWDTESDWPEEVSAAMVLDYADCFLAGRRVYKEPSEIAISLEGLTGFLVQLPDYWRASEDRETNED